MHNPVKHLTVEQETLLMQGTTTDDQFVCELCSKSFDSAFKEVHMLSHSGAASFLCSACNKQFPNENDLMMHLKAHNDPRVVSVVGANERIL